MNTLKNYRFHITLWRTAFFFLLLSLILLSKLATMQLLQYQKWQRLSENNQFSSQALPPERGFIFDRNARPLAVNTPRLDLQVLYHGPSDFHRHHTALSTLLSTPLPMPKHFKQLKTNTPVTLLKGLDHHTLHLLYSYAQDLPHLRVASTPIRTYPCKEACASITGYIQTPHAHNPASSKTFGESSKETQGVAGVEQSYQSLLSGNYGVIQNQRTAKGKITHAVHEAPPKHGFDILLTIDLRIQHILHNAMQGQKGAVVVSNPNNGEVLGLYSSPSFDPNLLIQKDDPAALKALFSNPHSPLLNRATSGLFPPASTIKPFLSLYGLEHHLIDPNTTIYDKGYYRYKDSDYYYHNWFRSGHGYVNLHKALVLSNDTYFYELGMQMGIDHIKKALDQFGFGHLTGIDLPQEKKGFVPSREEHAARGKKWLIGETLISVIGQGENLVTPISLARATNLIASKGFDHPLHLFKGARDPSGGPPPELPPKAKAQPPLSIHAHHWQRVHHAMLDVTQHGTGVRFGEFEGGFAAKTGTAQIIRGSNRHTQKVQKDHSWLIGFSPLRTPKISIVVLIENENIATLVARDIMHALKALPEIWN